MLSFVCLSDVSFSLFFSSTSRPFVKFSLFLSLRRVFIPSLSLKPGDGEREKEIWCKTVKQQNTTPLCLLLSVTDLSSALLFKALSESRSWFLSAPTWQDKMRNVDGLTNTGKGRRGKERKTERVSSEVRWRCCKIRIASVLCTHSSSHCVCVLNLSSACISVCSWVSDQTGEDGRHLTGRCESKSFPFQRANLLISSVWLILIKWHFSGIFIGNLTEL